MSTIRVRARVGIRVPMEGSPRRYVTDGAPVVLQDSPYYRRQMLDGDLILVADPAAQPAPETTP